MPKWLDRVEGALAADTERRTRAVKAFTMPPFWSDDGARVRLAASASMHPDREVIGEGFEEFASSMFKANGPVHGCIAIRARVFSQARLLFQRFQGGRPVELYGGGDPGLALLERPWDRGSTANLLTDMEIDGSLAGNHFAVMVDQSGRIGRQAKREDGAFLARMRPDWCTLIIHAPSGNPFNVDARVVALQYRPPGMANDPLLLTRKEFSHFAPMPDPLARFRGMSWLTPIIRDVTADVAYTTHATAFLKNGATPNLVVKVGEDVEDEEFKMFVAQFKEDYEGAANAYKTLFLAGGADVTPLSVDLNQVALRQNQAALETRIATAAGVHVILAGFSEGLGGSSLNEGNFGAARRLFVDSTIRDLWGKAAPALEIFAEPTRAASRLWYDARDIPFLRQDAGDEATTFQTQIIAIRQGVEAGFIPDDMVRAAKAADVSLLIGKHTGKVSVQLRDPNAPEPGAAPSTEDNGTGADDEDATTMPTLNGRTNGNAPALTAR